MRILRAGLIAAAAVMALAGAAAGAEPWRPQLSALEDKSGALSFAQLRASKPAFEPLNDTALRAGFTASAWWLRFTIPAARLRDGPQIIEMGTPLVDRIDFYAVSAYGQVLRLRAGDTLPFTVRPVAKRLLLFPLPKSWRGAVTVYARISGESGRTVPVKVWRSDAFEERWSDLQAFVGFFFAILVFALAYNFFVFLSLRDAAYGWYVTYLAAAVMLHISLLGLGPQFLWPSTGAPSNKVTAIAFGGVVILGAQYFYAFLSLRSEQPAVAKLFRGVQIAAACALLTAILVSYRTGTMLIMVVALTLMAFQYVAVIRANLQGYRPARYLLPPLFALVPAYAIALLAVWGVLPLTFFTEHAVRFATMFEAVVISLALADRFNVIRQENQEAERRLAAQRQQFAARLVDTQEAERRRIAADLHDTVAQNLLVIGNRLKELGGSTESERAALSELGDYSRQTLDEVRTILHDLHPSQLDRLGLATTLRSMVETALKDSGRQWRCEIDVPDDALPPASGIHLYRALQSALGNALRHSGASETTVNVQARNGAVTAIVSDNGRGFDPQDANGGLGLTAMRDRMAVIGGKLEIDAEPARGTTVRFVVPIGGGQ